tara:strand:- start:296 stop:1000 length:705 start_codon:yes stop_codon:yes gene_type:complete
MKHILNLASAILLISCSNTNSQIIENINASQFETLIKNQDGIILDVRTSEEFYSGHISDATNLDYYKNDFEEKLNIMRKDIPIYVYCRSGGRSKKAAGYMKNLGFSKVYNLIGGIGAWAAEGHQSVSSNIEKKQIHPIYTISEINYLVERHQSVLINFSTDWCIPCKKMKQIITEIKKIKPDLKIILVDADANKELTKSYNINGVPVLIILKNSEEIFRHTGIISKEELLNKLD